MRFFIDWAFSFCRQLMNILTIWMKKKKVSVVICVACIIKRPNSFMSNITKHFHRKQHKWQTHTHAHITYSQCEMWSINDFITVNTIKPKIHSTRSHLKKNFCTPFNSDTVEICAKGAHCTYAAAAAQKPCCCWNFHAH